MKARRQFTQAWGRYGQIASMGAEVVESMEGGGGEWWNDGLDSADRVEGVALKRVGQRMSVGGEFVATAIKAEAAGDENKEIVTVLLEASVGRGAAAPVGAWALAFEMSAGLVG
jgi:hypothetical protein